MTTKNLTHRELAWQALKQTRNPEYVHCRYGFPIDVLTKALEKMPDEKPLYEQLREKFGNTSRASDEPVSESLPQGRLPGEDDESG